jgi:hypothetical protein
VAGGPGEEVVRQVVGEHARILAREHQPLLDRQQQAAPLVTVLVGVDQEGVQGQRGGAAPGLGQGLVAVAVDLAEQAALGQADADEILLTELTESFSQFR